jgi:hypothetical protein
VIFDNSILIKNEKLITQIKEFKSLTEFRIAVARQIKAENERYFKIK